MRVLDIGCGWGSFMNYAAKHYGVICDGLTLSAEQVAMGKEKCAGLPINFILTDYREFQPEKPYDRIVSIGMLEHVGPDNYDDYFKCAERFLASDGIFLLHTIGGDVSNRSEDTDPWIRKYIFPNGVIPSIAQLGKATEKRFNIEDLHNIGPDYDKTLMAWHENFEAAWPELSEKYGERFYRMWRYYLLSCAGGFRSRQLGVWQLALTKDGRAYPDCVRAI
jgi:cyclopropane-fatty-acyl-phospholipid synthase